jgi:hypothetical protein
MAEAGEKDTPSNADPSSPTLGSKSARDGADDADAGGSAPKRSRGDSLALDDQEGFAAACDQLAPLFTDNTFPSVPRSCIEGLPDSLVAAACAHVVTTKAIAFPFHRQFTSAADVTAMLTR